MTVVGLSTTYKCIAEYMAANKLVINGDKTHLLVMGTQAMSGGRQQVQLRAVGRLALDTSNSNRKTPWLQYPPKYELG